MGSARRSSLARAGVVLLAAIVAAAVLGVCLNAVGPQRAYAADAAPVKVKSVKVVDKTTSSLTVSWPAASGASKYQVAYKAKSSDKWAYSVSKKARKCTISRLKSYTTYQVKVRGVSGGEKGKWSVVKTVSTKRKPYTFLKTLKTLKIAQETDKIIVVNVKTSTSRSCIVQYFKKTKSGWKEAMRVNGVVGKNGIDKGKEGDGKTSTGMFRFTKLFGIKADPGTLMSYTKLTSSMYWCGSKKYYNQFIDESKTKAHKKYCDRGNDEHLIDNAPHYNYAAAFDFNSEGAYKKGSAIFLHCKRPGGKYTAGCVAVDEKNMKKLIKQIDEDTVIIIDKYANITSKKY